MENKNPHNRVGELFIQLGQGASKDGFLLRNCPDRYEVEDLKEKVIYRFDCLRDVEAFLNTRKNK